MDRQTLDMEGARQGDIASDTLQLADVTIAIGRIATMTIENHWFKPWDTPGNQRTQRLYATVCVGMLFFGLLGFAWWFFAAGRESGVIALMFGAVLFLIGLGLGVRAAMLFAKLNKTEPYYRLLIATSASTEIKLVDNSREVLEQIRDAVRYKMDTGDTELTGDFDLNLDIVNVRLPKGARRPARLSVTSDETPPAA